MEETGGIWKCWKIILRRTSKFSNQKDLLFFPVVFLKRFFPWIRTPEESLQVAIQTSHERSPFPAIVRWMVCPGGGGFPSSYRRQQMASWTLKPLLAENWWLLASVFSTNANELISVSLLNFLSCVLSICLMSKKDHWETFRKLVTNLRG